MPYAFIQDVPTDESVYAQVRGRLGAAAPKGLISHVVVKHDGGLRHIDVWDTEADWARFRDEQVEPAVSEVLSALGIPRDDSQVAFEDVEVVDTWVGAAPAS
jgi:hypothetical protein